MLSVFYCATFDGPGLGALTAVGQVLWHSRAGPAALIWTLITLKPVQSGFSVKADLTGLLLNTKNEEMDTPCGDRVHADSL